MSKNSNNENIARLYDDIDKAFRSEGCTLEEAVELGEEGDELIDYNAVNSSFDKIMSLESFARRLNNYGILPRFSLLSFGREIAAGYVKDNGMAFEIVRTEEEARLGAIYSYAQRRGLVERLSHYVDNGKALMDTVIERLETSLTAFQIGEESRAREISELTLRAEEFRKIGEHKKTGELLIKSYSKNHRQYASSIKR